MTTALMVSAPSPGAARASASPRAAACVIVQSFFPPLCRRGSALAPSHCQVGSCLFEKLSLSGRICRSRADLARSSWLAVRRRDRQADRLERYVDFFHQQNAAPVKVDLHLESSDARCRRPACRRICCRSHWCSRSAPNRRSRSVTARLGAAARDWLVDHDGQASTSSLAARMAGALAGQLDRHVGFLPDRHSDPHAKEQTSSKRKRGSF